MTVAYPLQWPAGRVEALEEARVEYLAELLYLRKYGKIGAIWSANETKDVWRYEARLALAQATPADAKTEGV